MREPVAVFGGSFDPVHSGHIRIAEELISRTHYNTVIWVPAARNPLKLNSPEASDHDRLSMLTAALSGCSWSIISDIELRRGGASYSLETLLDLRKQYGLKKPIGFLLGDDAFCSLTEWFEYERLIQIAEFLVFNRKGNSNLNIEQCEQQLFSDGGRMQRIDLPEIRISSTAIRQKAAVLDLKNQISDLVPQAVLDYIVSNNLYGSSSYSLIRARVKSDLSEERYIHTLSVENTARQLAVRHGHDPEASCLAAISHDIAREWKSERLLGYVENRGLEVDDYMLQQPVLLHGAVAADIIVSEYGICNELLIQAVRHHTLGCAGLNEIGQILYLADYIEPGRGILAMEDILTLQNMNLSQSCMRIIEDQNKRFGSLLPATESFYRWLRGD
ncbi:nicotinate-nucleotide adenylyltransferase [Spirochaeta dissipatitropha]